MTDGELVERIRRCAGGKAGYKQLVRELGLGGGRERRLLLEQLARLTASGRLVKMDGESWGLPRRDPRPAAPRENQVAGRIHLHRDGYGFVRPNRGSAGTDTRQAAASEDIFIPPSEINAAMQGDQVLVELDPQKADGRVQGHVVRVLGRRYPTVVGIFHYAHGERERHNFLTPFDDRMTQPILIPAGAEALPNAEEATPHRVLGREAAQPGLAPGSLEGLVVDVEITTWPTIVRPAIGRVIEVLGSPDDFGVDVEMMIRKHQLPRIFPEAVLAEARAVAHLDAGEVAHRRDFRKLPIVTIDGETARDFDDAVLVRERGDGKGYELQVHIADVAQYVLPGSALDQEARLRGTSVYFPDRAIPMLPQELSSDICSLRPNEDRLVLSCIIQLDATGRIESYEIAEGAIRSAARMTYSDVHAVLEGDAEARSDFGPLVEGFERMKRLAILMNQRREERGSIDFDLPEPVIDFDDDGQMRGVTRGERTWANRLIEEFMLAANECVATWLEDLGVPSLYRIHKKPEPRRVVEFEELALSFGFSLGLGPLPVRRVQTRAERRESRGQGRKPRIYEVPEDIAVTPQMYQKLAARIEGKPEERILSYLMLRSLSQARYSEKNEGHFALAAPTYTHFTSPIRRYPDLIVHRIAKTLLCAGVSGKKTVDEGRLDSPWLHPQERRVGIGAGGSRRVFSAGPWASSAGPRDGEQSSEQTDGSRAGSSLAERELSQIAEESSYAERRAAEAERELVEWKKVRFMQDRVGDEFDALVMNPAKYGLFVELTEFFVEGLVPIDTLRADHYTWREHTHEIVGEGTGHRFRAGDRVQVILDRVLAQERKLQFAVIEDDLRPFDRKPVLSPETKKRTKARPNRKKR